MKKYRLLLIISLLVLIGLSTWFFAFRKKEMPPTVETEKPQMGDISNSITATGTIQPVDTVSVGAQVSGTIQYIYADFNSAVKKGQLIAQIDKTVLAAQVNQIEANLASAQSQLVYQKSNFDRQTELYNLGAISKADDETALYQYNTAKGQVANLQSQLTAAKKNLSFTEIYSPIDGTVLSRNVNVGQTVASSFNTPTLFIIAKDLTKMQVQAAVDEADIGNVTKGQQVSFTVDAFPDDTFNGTVQDIRLDPTVSANVVTYATIINAPNANMKLKPGMTASVIIYTKQQKNVILIPAKALTFNPDSSLLKQFKIIGRVKGAGRKRTGGYDTSSLNTVKAHVDSLRQEHKRKDTTAKPAMVWVRQGDTLLQKRIFTGLNDDTQVEVIHGLSPDDEVVLTIQQMSGKTDKGTDATRSPFMPQRRQSAGGRQGR